MFEKQLETALKSIFRVKKVTYDQPGPNGEQEVLFVEIEDVKPTIKNGRELAKVSGTCVMNAPADKLTFGFFARAIAQAPAAATKPFFFYEMETSTRRIQNIVQRGFSFIYFYDAQYDPDVGLITSVTITQETT